jgi:rubrerythrin
VLRNNFLWYDFLEQSLYLIDNRTEGMAMNILDFAMKMELDGKAYYEKLADETIVDGLKSIFTSLATDEQKHFEIIQGIKAGTKQIMADSMVLEKAKNLFEVIAADKNIAGSLKKSLEGYQHARKIEADSVRFYEDMAKKEDNPETVQLLLRIANEEKKHFNIMDNLSDYTLAPQNFLAWGEFSNLKEL